MAKTNPESLTWADHALEFFFIIAFGAVALVGVTLCIVAITKLF